MKDTNIVKLAKKLEAMGCDPCNCVARKALLKIMNEHDGQRYGRMRTDGFYFKEKVRKSVKESKEVK
jgi:hypothetical protein